MAESSGKRSHTQSEHGQRERERERGAQTRGQGWRNWVECAVGRETVKTDTERLADGQAGGRNTQTDRQGKQADIEQAERQADKRQRRKIDKPTQLAQTD